jgi:hypothetical protein
VSEIHIGGDSIGSNIIGSGNTVGDVVVDRSAARASASSLLTALRAEVSAKDDVPGKESALEALADLEEEIARDEPREAVAQHLLGKLSTRLTGALAVATSVAELAEKVKGLF